MSTPDGCGKLVGSDVPNSGLLGHVSCYVSAKKLKQFAVGPLGLDSSRYNFVEADFPQNAARISFEVRILT